jgi:hypothetical protein
MKKFRCISPTKRHINERLSNIQDRVKWIQDYYELPLNKIDGVYYGGWNYIFEKGDIIELYNSNGYDKTSFRIIIKNTKGILFHPYFVCEFGNYKNSEWIINHFIEIF